jgi:hypothetical protein
MHSAWSSCGAPLARETSPLVFGARDECRNDAVVLMQVLAEQLADDPL